MKIAEVAECLDGQLLVPGREPERHVGHVVASDLMSDVLVIDTDDILLVTSLASDQVLRTAHIVGAMGVVVSNGKPLPSTMREVARDLGMALVTAPKPKYENCVRLHAALDAGGNAGDADGKRQHQAR